MLILKHALPNALNNYFMPASRLRLSEQAQCTQLKALHIQPTNKTKIKTLPIGSN